MPCRKCGGYTYLGVPKKGWQNWVGNEVAVFLQKYAWKKAQENGTKSSCRRYSLCKGTIKIWRTWEERKSSPIHSLFLENLRKVVNLKKTCGRNLYSLLIKQDTLNLYYLRKIKVGGILLLENLWRILHLIRPCYYLKILPCLLRRDFQFSKTSK